MEPTLEEHLLREAKDGGFSIQSGEGTVYNAKFKGVNRSVWGSWLPKWAVNMARNYPRVSNGEGAEFLIDAARGIPAVVIGIGPSLDQDMAALARARQNAILIATDASLRALQANGIQPHLVIQFDCKAKNATMFDGGVKTEDLVLVANTCIHPDVIDAWKGRFIFYNMGQRESEFTEHILPSIYPGIGRIDNCGTVGNAGLHLANLMGCRPVLLSGMDLCYQPAGAGGQFRYRCTDYRWREEDATGGFPARWEPTENKVLYDNAERLRDSFEVEIRHGKYRVDPELDFYRKILIELVGAMDMTIVNCAEKGVMAGLMETMPLAKALETYCQPAFNRGSTVVPHLFNLLPDIKEASHA